MSIGLVIIESTVVTKTSLDANNSSELYCAANKAVVVAAGIAVKIVETPISILLNPKNFVMTNVVMGITASRMTVKKAHPCQLSP